VLQCENKPRPSGLRELVLQALRGEANLALAFALHVPDCTVAAVYLARPFVIRCSMATTLPKRLSQSKAPARWRDMGCLVCRAALFCIQLYEVRAKKTILF
jgi:hypothetical protein